MKLCFLSFTTLLVLILSGFQTAFASCDVGPVLFRDTLYGAAVGTGVGALILFANSNTSSIAPTLATSALVGAGVGAVIGVVEISLSNCTGGHKNHDDGDNYGFNVKPMLTVVNNMDTPSLQSSTDKFKLNEVVGGVTLVYALN